MPLFHARLYAFRNNDTSYYVISYISCFSDSTFAFGSTTLKKKNKLHWKSSVNTSSDVVNHFSKYISAKCLLQNSCLTSCKYAIFQHECKKRLQHDINSLERGRKRGQRDHVTWILVNVSYLIPNNMKCLVCDTHTSWCTHRNIGKWSRNSKSCWERESFSVNKINWKLLHIWDSNER